MSNRPTVEQEIEQVTTLLAKRLLISEPAAKELAAAYVLGTLDNAVASIESLSVAPTSMAAHRVQLVENIAFRLGRLPSARELTALLRLPETTSKSVLRNVLAMSDRVKSVALKSAFSNVKKEPKRLGNKGAVPGGAVWAFKAQADLDQARALLDEHGIAHSTLDEADGKWRLAVDGGFNPDDL